MFTLGNKEAIVNSTTAFPFEPTAAGVDILNIKGFGTFSKLKVVSAIGRRASDAQYEKLSFTCPAAADLGIAATEVGVAVIVHLRVNSLRQASESAIDFIKRGRPMILEVKVNGGNTAVQIAAAVYAAFNEYALKFANVTLPITAAYTAGNDYIVLTATQGYFSINENVAFLKRGDIFALNAVSTKIFATTLDVTQSGIGGEAAIPAAGDSTIVLSALSDANYTLTVGDTIYFGSATTGHKITDIVTSTKTVTFTPVLTTPVDALDEDLVSKECRGVEAINDGKYLEENVRMSTPFTSDAYAINANQVPIIGAKYTMIQWVSDDLAAVGGWQAHKNPGAVGAAMTRHKYTLYFNEDVSLGATSQVKYLADWLIAGAPGLGDFRKANGAKAESVADFWA